MAGISPEPKASEKKARPRNLWATIFVPAARKEIAAVPASGPARAPKKSKSSAKNKKK